MVASVLPNENLSSSIMVHHQTSWLCWLSWIAENITAFSVFSNCRLFRHAYVSRHHSMSPKSPFILVRLSITALFHVSDSCVYFRLPSYHGIIGITKSPFISVCQNITAFISYHRVCYIMAYIGSINYSDS